MGRRASSWSEHAPKNGRGRANEASEQRAPRAKSQKSELHVCAPCANHETAQKEQARDNSSGRCVARRRNCTSHEATIKLIHVCENIIRWEARGSCSWRAAKGASLMLIKRFWQPQITGLVCKLAFRTLTHIHIYIYIYIYIYKTEHRQAGSPTLKTTD